MSRPSRRGLDIHGVLLLDKPYGISSNNALQEVKRIYNANRAGHTGALDPLATGMLPICFGEATKFAHYLLNSDKRYQVTAKFNQKIDSVNEQRQTLREIPISLNKEILNLVLDNFRGNIMQIPPMYSALKYRGRKLYEYARQGIEVPRKPRLVTVYKLTLISYKDMEIELDITCSKGTYIRTIIDDLGSKLGYSAYIIQLRRLTVNNYKTKYMIKLEYLRDLVDQAHREGIQESKLLYPLLMPIDSTVSCYPIVNLPITSSAYFKNGNPIRTVGAPIKGLVRVTEGDKGKFIGIGEIDDEGRVAPRRLVSIT